MEVQFVDLGNRKILSVSDLRKIKDEFFALPARVRPQNFMYFLFFNYYSLSEFIACKQNLQYLQSTVSVKICKNHPVKISSFLTPVQFN